MQRQSLRELDKVQKSLSQRLEILLFQNTDAYLWLVNNAAAYGFEESFSRGNQQGVSFEPWYWRYVGSARAADVFRDSW